MPGIYLHIPFWMQACTCCDFHFSTLLKNKPELVKGICKEIELRKDYLATKKIESIYFGGGTPSLLSKEELQNIFTTLSNYFVWDKQIEITLECNPDDLTKEKLQEFVGADQTFTEHYTTHFPDQTSVRLDVLQYRGPRNAEPSGPEPVTPAQCERLGSWEFGGLRPRRGTCAAFTVTFAIDQNGILQLIARETATGRTLTAQVERGIG